MSLSGLGVFFGLVLATGLLLALSALPITRRPTLTERVEPYVLDTPRPSRLLGEQPGKRPVQRLLAASARRLDHALGGSASVRRRLERAGMPPDVESFRVQQVIYAVGGAVGAALVAPVVVFSRGMSVLPAVLLVLCAAAVGAMARDYQLGRLVQKREAEMVAAFPSVAQLLALSVTAGEGIIPALERVARVSSGPLSVELRACLAESRSIGIVPALHGMSQRTGLPALARFVDGLVVALERGTPLGEVLRAQAADAQEAHRQAVIEAGGRREIAMMIPVVFLVLPVTILFAVYPGLSMLRLNL